MKIYKFNSENGDLITQENFFPSMFDFDNPPPIDEDYDDDVVNHNGVNSQTKPIFIEGDSNKKLLCIENDSDLRAYLKLCTNLGVNMSDRSEFKSSDNPLIDAYDSWIQNWRAESVENAYAWREGLGKFTDLVRDREVIVYLSKLATVRFAIVGES